MSDDRPPKKRLHLTLTIDAHSLLDLTDVLERISNDLYIEQREERDVMTGDGSYKLTVANSVDYTLDEYEADLLAWHDRRISERRKS